jgi:hypothetical protein
MRRRATADGQEPPWVVRYRWQARTLKAANATAQPSWRESPGTNGGVFSIPKEVSTGSTPSRDGLSVRAQNVLKVLAAELTGEDPPKGRWVPPANLLRKLSYRDLQVARNCGRHTTEEIVQWAGTQGVVIERPLHAGKSLSAMWREIVARSSTAEFSKAEIAAALERSLRRRNTRIPVAFQSILVKALSAKPGS